MPLNSLHNHDDKYLARPGIEPGISRLQAPIDTNEPSEHYRARDEDCYDYVTPGIR